MKLVVIVLAISKSHYLNISTFDVLPVVVNHDGVRKPKFLLNKLLIRAEGSYFLRKLGLAGKKSSGKALIPLPATGFASFFCATPVVVQTNLWPKRAVGLDGGVVISFCAKC